MKASFNRRHLLNDFNIVSSVAPTRSPKPILQNVLMTTDGHEVTLIGTDTEIGIRKTIPMTDVTVFEPGQVILPVDRFGSILRTSNDDQISVEVDDGKIIAKTKSGRFTLNAEDPALFPEVPGFDSESYAAVVDEDLAKLIKRTSYATDTDSARYALSGALVEIGDGFMALVATDGRRLAKAICSSDVFGAMGEIGKPVIPLKALKLIERSLPNTGSQVHVAFQVGRAVMIRTEDAVIYARLVDGRFPAYAQIIPESAEVKVPFKVGELRAAIDLAAICLDRESRGVELAFGVDKLTLSATTADVGQSRVTLPYATPIDGLNQSVTLNANYAVDLLRSLDPDLDIVMEMNGHDEPVAFKEGEALTAIIQPIVLPK